MTGKDASQKLYLDDQFSKRLAHVRTETYDLRLGKPQVHRSMWKWSHFGALPTFSNASATILPITSWHIKGDLEDEDEVEESQILLAGPKQVCQLDIAICGDGGYLVRQIVSTGARHLHLGVGLPVQSPWEKRCQSLAFPNPHDPNHCQYEEHENDSPPGRS